MATLRQEAENLVLDALAEKTGVSRENLEFNKNINPVMEEMIEDKEIELMIQDINKAIEREKQVNNISIEAFEIIGGLTEIVMTLFNRGLKR